MKIYEESQNPVSLIAYRFPITIDYCQLISIDFNFDRLTNSSIAYAGTYKAKAMSRLGARARPLCPGTKRNIVQTPWCPKFRFNLLQCCHLVTTAVTSNHRETWVKNMALMKSCADKCSCPGTVPEYYLWRECPYPGTMLRFLYGHH